MERVALAFIGVYGKGWQSRISYYNIMIVIIPICNPNPQITTCDNSMRWDGLSWIDDGDDGRVVELSHGVVYWIWNER